MASPSCPTGAGTCQWAAWLRVMRRHRARSVARRRWVVGRGRSPADENGWTRCQHPRFRVGPVAGWVVVGWGESGEGVGAGGAVGVGDRQSRGCLDRGGVSSCGRATGGDAGSRRDRGRSGWCCRGVGIRPGGVVRSGRRACRSRETDSCDASRGGRVSDLGWRTACCGRGSTRRHRALDDAVLVDVGFDDRSWSDQPGPVAGCGRRSGCHRHIRAPTARGARRVGVCRSQRTMAVTPATLVRLETGVLQIRLVMASAVICSRVRRSVLSPRRAW